jgi:transposase-like protein
MTVEEVVRKVLRDEHADVIRESVKAITRELLSRIAGLLDEHVRASRERPLEGRYPYLFVGRQGREIRDGGRVQRTCVVIAHARP